MGIDTSIETTILKKILVYGAKKVSQKDHFELAIEDTLEKLKKEYPEYDIVIEEIYYNRKEIFEKIEIANETEFREILNQFDVEPEICSKLYPILHEKFNKIIEEASKEKPSIFNPYVIREFKKLNASDEQIREKLQELKFEYTWIIEVFEKLTKNNDNFLIRIESELKKSEKKEAKFFRKQGAYWIDFESGFVVKRKEVDRIITELKTNSNRIMLVGNPASGKSVIARNVGYELTNETDVFYINSKILDTHKVDAIFSSIKNLEDDAVVIIEDVHLYPEHCNDLIKQIKDKEKKVKLLFTARPTYERHGIESSELKECTILTLEPFDSAEAIIKKYAEKMNLPQPSEDEIDEFKYQSMESLWVLAYFLLAWEPRKPIEIKRVYEKVYQDLKALDGKYYGSMQVIFALAPFYKYEINVKRGFLKKLKLNEDTLQKLIDFGEIRESDGYISLNHSALASLYLMTYGMNPDSVEPPIDEIDWSGNSIEDYVVKMFSYYLIKYKSSNYVEFFDRLYFKEELVSRIFSYKETLDAFCNLHGREKHLENIGRCVSILLRSRNVVDKGLLNVLKSKLDDETDIENIRRCVKGSVSASSKIVEILVESLDIETLNLKLEQEPDIEKIGRFMRDISIANLKIGKSLTESIKNNLKIKIEQEPNIKKIGRCVSDIYLGPSSTVGKELIDSLDIEKLKTKIERESDNEKTYYGVIFISRVSNKVGKELVKFLKIKLEQESDIENIGVWVNRISKDGSSEVGKTLVESLDFDNLKLKLKSDPDIDRICRCVKNIYEVSSEVGKALVKSLNVEKLKSKLKQESDIENISYCISNISTASSEVGKELVDVVKLKIKTESDIRNICSSVIIISNSSSEVGKALVESLDLENLKSKLIQEPDIRKICSFVGVVLSESSEFGKELVDVVKLKIETESDIEKICSSVIIISNSSSEVGKALVESLDLENLKSKLMQESDIRKICSSVSYISRVSSKAGKELVDVVIRKMELESDNEKKTWCVIEILNANVEVGKALIESLRTEKIKKQN